MTQTYDALVDAHLSAWNASPGPGRERAISAIYARDVTIGEPAAAHAGHEGMTRAIEDVQAQLPGAVITRSGPIQTAQDLVTYSWNLGPANGSPLVTGRDVLIIRDGVIQSLYVLIDAS